MQAPKSNVGAWVKAGRSASKSVLDNFEVARAYSPDYTGMAIQGMKARTEEKAAAMKANAKVAEAQMTGSARVAIADLKIDAFEAKNAAKKQVAKGGMIAKAGGLIGAAFADDGPEKPTDYSMLRSHYEKQQGRLDERRSQLAADYADKPDSGETIDRITTPRTGTPIAGAPVAAGLENNIQPAASQQTPQKETVGITTSSNVKPSKTVSSMGFSDSDFDVYKKTVGHIESGNVYNKFGGSNDHYDGRWQMGKAAKTDAAKILGIADPGHTPAAREAFRTNPGLQDQMFEAYTKANHNYLMRVPEYANADSRRRLEILGYAHNQGMGNAADWLKTGKVGYDGFNTPGTRYSTDIKNAFSGL